MEINTLSQEIEKRRADIEERRQKVQSAMDSEYQTFSSKLHKAISTDLEKVAFQESAEDKPLTQMYSVPAG